MVIVYHNVEDADGTEHFIVWDTLLGLDFWNNMHSAYPNTSWLMVCPEESL